MRESKGAGMSWNRTPWIALLALGLLFACTQSPETTDDPRKRLTDYISKSFSVRSVDEKEQLLNFLTGDAKIRLAAWSEDQFRQAFIYAKRQFLKLSFKETKTVSSKEMTVTYELSYLDAGKGHEAKVTHKKLAQMNMDQGKWYISEVRNIKELIEYRNEMSLP